MKVLYNQQRSTESESCCIETKIRLKSKQTYSRPSRAWRSSSMLLNVEAIGGRAIMPYEGIQKRYLLISLDLLTNRVKIILRMTAKFGLFKM